MKPSLFLILIFSITFGAVDVLATSENEPTTTGTTNLGCPAEEEEVLTPKKPFLRAFTCVDDVFMLLKAQLKLSYTSDERRDVIKLYCEKKPLSECMMLGKNYIERCHRESMNESISALVETVGSSLDVICEDSGAKAAAIYEEYLTLTEDQKLTAKHCVFFIPIGRMPTAEEYLALGYVMLRDGRPCLVKKGTGVFHAIQDVDAMIQEILTKMKCPHATEHNIIMCTDIKLGGDD